MMQVVIKFVSVESIHHESADVTIRIDGYPRKYGVYLSRRKEINFSFFPLNKWRFFFMRT